MTLRETSIERVLIALHDEVPEAALGPASERAEALVAIVEHFQLAVDPLLLQWVHFRAPGKQWSGEELTRYCIKYIEARTELERRAGVSFIDDLPVVEEEAWTPVLCPHCSTLLGTQSVARSHVCRIFCPRCFAHEAIRANAGYWLCPNCGQVS